jgi:hypothetical protein
MSWTDDAWLRTAFEALKSTLDVDRHLKKEMIQFLLDEGFWDKDKLEWDSAVARFNACLNPNKPDFFKIGEVWALMKRFRRYQLFLALAEDLGFEARLKPTEERRQALLERLVDAAERCENQLAAARAELQRIDNEAPTTTVTRLPLSNGRAHFSKDGSNTGVP